MSALDVEQRNVKELISMVGGTLNKVISMCQGSQFKFRPTPFGDSSW